MSEKQKESVLKSDYVFTSVFLSILNLDLISHNLLGIINRMKMFKSAGIFGLFKITIIIQVAWLAFWLIMRERKLKIVRPVSALFLAYVFISAIVGLTFGNINSKFLTQAFEYVIPILMIGFSKIILESIQGSQKLKQKWERIVIINSYLYIICTILFRIMYRMGFMYWNAYTSWACLFLIPYLLFATDRTMLGFALCGAAVLSGGRSTFVRAIAIVMVYYFSSKRPLKKKVKETVLLLAGVAIAAILLQRTNYFERILLTINTLSSDDPDLNLATGGRMAEIERIVPLMNSRPISWLIGNGFGIYQVTSYNSVRGFAHFMPMTYIMISGTIFTAVLYFNLLLQSLKLFLTKTALGRMLCCYLFVVVVIGSFFDASMSYDYKYWLIVGFSYCYTKQLYNPHRLLLRNDLTLQN